MNRQASELFQFFNAGVDAVKGEAAVINALNAEPLDSELPVHVLAVGKAADAMMRGAITALKKTPVCGLVITKHDHISSDVLALPWNQVVESSHPVPDDSSLFAGAKCIDFVRSIPEGNELLVLMSGGASSLLEHLIDGLQLSDLQQLNQALISGGLPIDSMNQVRKTVSAIKGGKLCSFIPQGVQVTQLVISDVPNDKLSDIGSGVFAMPESDGFAHPGELIDSLPIALPDNLVACINAFGVCPPAATANVWHQINSTVVGSCELAQKAVSQAATKAGIPVVQSCGSLHGDVEEIASKIAQALLDDCRTGLRIWGGETHLVLPKKPGRGGRNQHLALAIAKRIDGHKGLSVLCCGTDGSDGPTADAGGIVTGETVAKGMALGLSIDEYLFRADAGHFLEAIDALVTTGPTGTNVMDLVVAQRHH